MKKTVVLYPGLAVSHFVPMVQLADVLLEEGYAVVVAFIDPTLKGDIALAAVIDRVAASKPSVAFHMLPRVEDAPAFVLDSEFMVRYTEFVGRYSQHLHDFLLSMPSASVHALIVDMLSIEVLHVTSKLGIPAYTFFLSNASALAVSVQLQAQASSLGSEGQPSFGELGDTPLDFHGVPPIPASHLNAEMLQYPGCATFKATVNMFRRIQESNGILVNTSASIEPRAVSALGDPRRFPKMPPVYCVGPLVAGNGGEATEKHECLAWLDEQPEQSVEFLCFGSTGVGNHSEEQLKEIATGLKRSGHRFLWVVRAPPPADPEKPYDPRADPDLDALLPAGFLERTGGRGRGRVVKLWRPRRQAVAAAGGRAPSRGDGGVRDALWVELGAGGDRRWRADAVLASVRGAEDEQGVHGGGIWSRRGDGRLAAWSGVGRGGGGQGEAGDGGGGRQAAEGTGGQAQGRCGNGVDGWRLVARCVCPVPIASGQHA